MERIAINENGNAREVSVVRYIKNNEVNYATATYYLLVKDINE